MHQRTGQCHGSRGAGEHPDLHVHLVAVSSQTISSQPTLWVIFPTDVGMVSKLRAENGVHVAS